MKWLELCIDTARDGLDKLEAMLSALGIDGIEIEDEADFQSFLAVIGAVDAIPLVLQIDFNRVADLDFIFTD